VLIRAKGAHSSLRSSLLLGQSRCLWPAIPHLKHVCTMRREAGASSRAGNCSDIQRIGVLKNFISIIMVPVARGLVARGGREAVVKDSSEVNQQNRSSVENRNCVGRLDGWMGGQS
jgi:hypothetical protein